MGMNTFYIATSLSRIKEHHLVRDMLHSEGYKITYDWTSHGSARTISTERLAEVAELEIEGVLEADFVIVLLPGGKGTHTEFGMALASGKPIIIHSEDPAPFQLGEQTVAFYHVPNITHICCPLSSPQAILEAVKGLFSTIS